MIIVFKETTFFFFLDEKKILTNSTAVLVKVVASFLAFLNRICRTEFEHFLRVIGSPVTVWYM